MGDIKFKISGTCQPFMTQLYNATCSAVLYVQAVEYSGTCVTFGNLAGNTCYHVKITDVIGGTYWSGFTTPTSYIAPSLPSKVATLLGTPTSTQQAPYVCTVTEPKLIQITPPLKQNESVCVELLATTCNITNSSNGITLYCKPYGSSTYVQLSPTWLNYGASAQSKKINITYGDFICYTVATTCNQGATISCGCSILCLNGITGTCVNASVGTANCLQTSVNYVQTTTIAPTTIVQSPVVYLGNITCSIGIESTFCVARVSAVICTSRPLTLSDGFRLCFRNDTILCKEDEAFSKAPHVYSYLNYIPNNYCCNFSDIIAPDNFAGCIECDMCNYVDINSANIGCYKFCAIARMQRDTSASMYEYATFQIYDVACRSGADWLLGTKKCSGVIIDYLTTDGCCCAWIWDSTTPGTGLLID